MKSAPQDGVDCSATPTAQVHACKPA